MRRAREVVHQKDPPGISSFDQHGTHPFSILDHHNKTFSADCCDAHMPKAQTYEVVQLHVSDEDGPGLQEMSLARMKLGCVSQSASFSKEKKGQSSSSRFAHGVDMFHPR